MKTINRRQFLQGVGGATLALPFLPSLWGAKAYAQTTAPMFFVGMLSQHGGIDVSNYYPESLPANEEILFSGDPAQGLDHRMRWGLLSDHLSSRVTPHNPNGDPQLSNVLGSFLNPYLDKINLIRGMDLMFGDTHHRGVLGNFIDNDSNAGIINLPTIDNVIGESGTFYMPGDTFTVRTMTVSAFYGPLSWVRRGSRIELAIAPGFNSIVGLFNTIFPNGGSGGGGNPDNDRQALLIDLVLSDYNDLINSAFGPGRRLSSSDRQRLDQYVTELTELQRRLRSGGGACNAVVPDNARSFQYEDRNLPRIEANWDAYLDVIVAGIRCGNSRIATMGLDVLSDYQGNWHQDIAHLHYNPQPQDLMVRSKRFAAEKIFTNLLSKLDIDAGTGDGSTYLDNGLVMWQQEAGESAHEITTLPTITAGSVAGAVNTGLYLDYRNLSSIALTQWSLRYPGLPQNRLLKSLLNAYGIPETEYSFSGLLYGYGDHYGSQGSYSGQRIWPQRVLDSCNNNLPRFMG